MRGGLSTSPCPDLASPSPSPSVASRWLPIRGGDEGRDGLGLVVPLSGQAFTSVSATPLPFRSLPAHAEPPHGSEGSLSPHETITPHLGLVDHDGFLIWLGLWSSGSSAESVWDQHTARDGEMGVPMHAHEAGDEMDVDACAARALSYSRSLSSATPSGAHDRPTCS